MKQATKTITSAVSPDCPPENIRALAFDVIREAVRDLSRKRDPVKALDALFFFASEDDFLFWTEFLGISPDPWKMLCNLSRYRYKGQNERKEVKHEN